MSDNGISCELHGYQLGACPSCLQTNINRLEAELAEMRARWAELRDAASNLVGKWYGEHGYIRDREAGIGLDVRALSDILDRLSNPVDCVRVVVAYDDVGTETLEFTEPTRTEFKKGDILYLVRAKGVE